MKKPGSLSSARQPVPPSERPNPFVQAQAQLQRAAEHLKLDPDIHAILSKPERELHVSLPVRMDNGEVCVFDGFRVQYNSTRGPYKGGIRFHPEETIDTIRALGAWMTWKTAVMALPLGGAKGGVICNPKQMSLGELERLSRSFIRHIWQLIGASRDIPAPDMYTNPQVMAWMMDEYCRIEGRYLPGVITGKPLEVGGSRGRDDATGRGGVYVLREAAEFLSIGMADATVAVQGYGNAGSYAAILAHDLLDAKIVAVSDSRGGIYCSAGLDPHAVLAHKNAEGTVRGFPGTEELSSDELLELPVDVLLPAGLEGVITKYNADRVKARIIGELANGPITVEADYVLTGNGIFVIPDILFNAGGVTISYFELVQNLNYDRWSLEDVQRRLDQKMTKAFVDVVEVYRKNEGRIDLRTAAYVVAVGRVAAAMQMRGLPL